MHRQEEDEHIRILPSGLFIRRLLLNSFFNSGEINDPIRHLFFRHLDEIEDEKYEEDISPNPNFMEEKNMNFRLYPFYIDWKKIEHNKPGYYRIFLRYGYLGSAVFSSLKDKYPSLDAKNILFILAEFIQENLVIKNNDENNNKNDDIEKNVKDFFDKLPNIKDLFELI